MKNKRKRSLDGLNLDCGASGDAESNMDDGISDKSEDEDVDETAHANLLKDITKIRDKKRLNVTRAVRTSSGAVKSLDKEDVLKRLGDSVLQKQSKKLKTLPKPLEKPVEIRAKKTAGYEKVVTEVNQWEKLVQIRRRADQLEFPLNQPDVRIKTIEAARQLPMKTSLEKEVYSLLRGAKLEEPKKEKPYKKYMTLTAIKERNREMWIMKELQRKAERKAWMQNKSKSRKYHRLLRKERKKKQKAELEELQRTNPEAALEILNELEKSRIAERMSLRHRQSKWSKTQVQRAKHDKTSLAAVQENERVRKELVKKINPNAINEDENKDDEDMETELEEREEAAAKGTYDPMNPWLTAGKKKTKDLGVGEGENEDESFTKFKKFWNEVNKRKVIEKKFLEEQAAKEEEQKEVEKEEQEGELEEIKKISESQDSDGGSSGDDEEETDLEEKEETKAEEEADAEEEVEEEADAEEKDLEEEADVEEEEADAEEEGEEEADAEEEGEEEADAEEEVEKEEEDEEADAEEEGEEEADAEEEGEEEADAEEEVEKEEEDKTESEKDVEMEGEEETKVEVEEEEEEDAQADKEKILEKSEVEKGRPCSGAKSEEEDKMGEEVRTSISANIEDKDKTSQDVDIDEIFDETEYQIQKKVGEKMGKLSKKRRRRKKTTPVEPAKGKPTIIEYDFTSHNTMENTSETLQRVRTMEEVEKFAENGAEHMIQKPPTILLRGDTDKEEVVNKENVEIDPTKFMQVKMKSLNSAKPGKMADEEALDDDDDDDDDQDEDDPQDVIREAFADDYLINEFKLEKEEAVKKNTPADICLALPGWGEWTGPNITMSKRKVKRFTVKVPKPKRKDSKLGHVIYNENADLHANLRKLMVSDLPREFSSVKDFEASVRAPIGRNFVPELVHRKLTKPPVITKMGTIIEPMEKEMLIQAQKKDLVVIGTKKMAKPHQKNNRGIQKKKMGKLKRNNQGTQKKKAKLQQGNNQSTQKAAQPQQRNNQGTQKKKRKGKTKHKLNQNTKGEDSK